MRGWLLLAAFVLAGCSDSTPAGTGNSSAQPALETAAIAAGVIPDPASTDLTGLYARDTDRVCIVPAAQDFRIGATTAFDDGQGCSAAGTVKRSGDVLTIAFDDAGGCHFDARFDGDRIVFPGALPAGCNSLCTGRASLAALSVDQLSDSASEASTLQDTRGRMLCGNTR